MLNFEFEAVHKRDGRKGRLVVDIMPPTRVEAFPDDFECRIQISGVEEKKLRAVGVTTFQAVELAMQVAKANLAFCVGEWDLFYEGQGPLPMSY